MTDNDITKFFTELLKVFYSDINFILTFEILWTIT